MIERHNLLKDFKRKDYNEIIKTLFAPYKSTDWRYVRFMRNFDLCIFISASTSNETYSIFFYDLPYGEDYWLDNVMRMSEKCKHYGEIISTNTVKETPPGIGDKLEDIYTYYVNVKPSIVVDIYKAVSEVNERSFFI